jgi:formylglycine-generating enzyme required for sulfatase activity
MASQPPPTGHVFISYAREDQAYARKLADGLRQRGFEIWMDDRIDFGDAWWREIVAAMRASAAVVVVMTPDSEGSEWVEREILLAQREKKPTFPLLLRGQENPLLITIQYADVTHGQLPSDSFYARLAQVAPPRPKVEKRAATPQPQRARVSEAAGPPAVERREPFEPELILIPAGEFLMGSDPNQDKGASDDDQPQHRLYLPEYYMAKKPVTNAQYAYFVSATGHYTPEGWKRGEPPAGKQHHPVVNVSWLDANAYCRWLSNMTGRPYRLPSEAEWEKAARGTDGRIYPWGDEPPDERRCNFNDQLGDTTPVGKYSPLGASPYGCMNMSGNVWEWTLSLWGKENLEFKYPYDPNDGREDLGARDDIRRVCRGGAFDSDQRLVRCASRAGGYPNSGYTVIGFRVCVGPRQ